MEWYTRIHQKKRGEKEAEMGERMLGEEWNNDNEEVGSGFHGLRVQRKKNRRKLVQLFANTQALKQMLNVCQTE